MTTITPTSSTSHLSGAHLDFGTEGGMALSPDVVIAMLRQRMGDVDDQIGLQMATMQDRTQMSERLAKKIQAAQLIQEAIQADAPNGDDKVDLSEVMVSYEGEEISAAELADKFDLGENASTQERAFQEKRIEEADRWVDKGWRPFKKKRAQKKKADAEAKLAGELSPTMNGKMIDGVITRLQGEARQINSGNEMRMVQLQSLMQQRSQVISMSTQMLNKIHESEQAITRNI